MFLSKKRDKEYLSVSPHKASDLLAPPAGHRMSACVTDGRRPDNKARPPLHGRCHRRPLARQQHKTFHAWLMQSAAGQTTTQDLACMADAYEARLMVVWQMHILVSL
jgi:hypothetical protein